MAMLKVTDLKVNYGVIQAIKGVSFEVNQGEVIATQDIVQEVLDVSASGNYLAVLMSNSLLIYDRNLEEYARLEDTGYANHVIMQSDGSALVIGGSTAFRFLP